MTSKSGEKDKICPPLPHLTPVLSNEYNIQARLIWFQALLGSIPQKWYKIKHLYLQSLGYKVTWLRFISYLISKLWDIYWDLWIHSNCIIHIPKGQVKMDLLEKINDRVRFHMGRGMSGLPTGYQLLFNTNPHSLLPHPEPPTDVLDWGGI